MQVKKLGIIAGATILVLGTVPAVADTADDVMAAARAQWKAQMDQASAAKMMETVADDYTEFNPDYPTRLDGKDLNTRLGEAALAGGGKLLVGDMVNPKVQVYGNVAILTYNFIGVGQNAQGENESITAKSTRVYAKQGGKWMLVHANFAPLTNSPDN